MKYIYSEQIIDLFGLPFSNTPSEDINFRIKHFSISTHPGLVIDSSMVILSVQLGKHVVKTNGKVMSDTKKLV